MFGLMLDELLTLVKLLMRFSPCEAWGPNRTVKVLHQILMSWASRGKAGREE